MKSYLSNRILFLTFKRTSKESLSQFLVESRMGKMKEYLVLCVVLSCWISGTLSLSCPQEGFELVGGECFFFNHPSNVSWFEADWICKSHKSQLAVLSNEATLIKVANHLSMHSSKTYYFFCKLVISEE